MKQAKGFSKHGLNIAMAYKADFILSIISMPILIVIFFFLWQSIFSISGVDLIRGYSLQQMVSYYVIATAVAIFIFSDIDHWMEWDVRSGRYVTELLRPANFMKNYYFRQLGIKFMALSVEIIPLFIIGFLFFSLVYPSILNGVLFLCAVFIASLLFFHISFMIGLLAFWMKRVGGLSKVKRQVISFFGGGLLPLTFFPLWLQTILRWSPFPYFRFIPINLYLGQYSIGESLSLLGVGVLWVVLFHVLSHYMWKAAQKHATGVGV